MSISNALNNAVSGLTANGKLADITSNNIANALTPGYARKVGSAQASILDGAGAGVRVAAVDRLYSDDLTRTRRTADGELASEVARSQALTALADLVGDPNDAGSLFAKYQAFESSLRSLADTPESGALQLNAVLAAGDIVGKFNALADRTRDIRQSAEGEIAQLVGTMNSNLEEIARLNRQIQVFKSGSRDASALEDRRESLVDEVASILPVKTQRMSDGTVTMMTREGIVLATTQTAKLEFSARPIVTPDMEYAGGSGILSGLTIDGVNVTPGGGGPQAIAGGALAGLFDVRDRIAPEFQAQIDAMAADLAGRFETAGLDPTTAPGSAGLFTDTGSPINSADILGLSSRIALNAAIDPAANGDPARMRDGLGAAAPGPSSNAAFPAAMLDALTESRTAGAIPGLSGLRSGAEIAAAFSELRSSARITSENARAALTSTRETLANAESETIGVDTDQELQQLLLIEQAYAANAQVVRTAAAMLDELRNLV